MATASLTKMSPRLPSESAPSQGLLMPKLKYRFRITFLNFGVSDITTELTKQVIDFTRPSVSFDDIEIDVYNSKIRLEGKHTWDNLTVNVRDDATGEISKLVGRQLQKQFDFMEQASAASGIDYKFQTRCEILDGGNGAHEPTVLEQWEVYGCYLQSVNYGDLNYSASEPATVAMTIRFDNAIQTDGIGQGGLGVDVGRALGNVVNG
jgi:hypothetical protein